MRRYISLLLFIGLAFSQDISIAVMEFETNGVSQDEARAVAKKAQKDIFDCVERAYEMLDEVVAQN